MNARGVGALWLMLAASCASAGELTDRWVYVSRGLTRDKDLDDFREIAATAAKHGFNGLCWSGLESICTWDQVRLARLETVKVICAQHKLELIPLLFSVGYGGAALRFDPNLAVGLPVNSAPFVVKDGRAALVPDPALKLRNGGFEDHQGHWPQEWNFVDKPGQLGFIDTEIHHGGEASLRLENPGARGLGPHARAMQQLTVKPHRRYRVRLWVRGESLAPAGAARVQLYGGKDGGALAAVDLGGESFEWKQVTLDINSGGYAALRLYIGTWGGQTGRLWVDDVSVEEVGLRNVVRRDGCPLSVTSEDGRTVYTEGRDFAAVSDPKLLDFGERPDLPLVLTPDSRIPPDARLLVSWYQASRVAGGQISVCMSAPRLYEHFAQVADRLAEVLPSKKFLLSMDEIREGGTDLADQQRKLSMAQILGDCLTRQQAILRRYHPGATCYVWSDMLDPQHNAHKDYYLVEGDFAGSVDYVPKDLVIACWWGAQCRRSLKFFDDRGFRTFGAAYYDANDLTGSRDWLAALGETRRAVGIMYTTWQDKYGLLADFGDLLTAR